MMRKNTYREFEKEVFMLLDMFRGKIKTEKVKYYMFSILSLRYANEKKERFVISEKSNWKQISNNGISIVERLQQGFEMFENENPSFKNVFTWIDFNILKEKCDKEMFKLVMFVDRLNFSQIDIGELTEFLFDMFSSKEGVKIGEFTTPKSISSLMVELVNDVKGIIYDPTVGSGSFLLEAWKNRDNNSEGLFGQELNVSTWSLCHMNLLLHGIENFSLKLGNVISEPLVEDGNLKKFDKVIMHPPFSLRDWGRELAGDDVFGRFRYGVPGRNHSDLAFLQIAISSLNENGKAAILIPYGSLFRSGMEEIIRMNLVNEDLIETIIGLPDNILQGTGIGSCILIVNKNKTRERKNKIQFINATERFETINRQNYVREEDVNWILSLYANKEETEGVSRLVDSKEIEANSYNLNPSRYFMKIKLNTVMFGEVYVDRKIYEMSSIDKVPLKDVGVLSRGYNITNLSKNDDGVNKVKVVNISDVDNGTIQIEKLSETSIGNIRDIEKYLAKPGDVLLSARGTTDKIVVVPETTEKLLVSNNFIIIRVFPDFNPYFIKTFLESPVGQHYLEVFQRGSVIKVLNIADIDSIKIPSVPLQKQEALMEKMKNFESAFKKQLEHIQEERIQQTKDVYDEMGILDSFE